MTDKQLTKLNHLINDRDMVQVGQWQMSKVVTDEFSSSNSIVPTKQHVETIDRSESHRTMWRHSDGKTWLTVSKHNNGTFETKWKVVVYMGGSDTVGPGWTCGINAYCDSPQKAIEWAHTYMKENPDMSHLYDEQSSSKSTSLETTNDYDE